MSNQPRYVPLGGGIDLQTPTRQLPPGACLYAINYECPVSGGYRRIEGYMEVAEDVPGEGPVLGVVTFRDDIYAIRKDVGTDTATLYRLNAGVWTTVAAVHNGRHEFVEGNVYATESGNALYGVGGGLPFEIKSDGTFTEFGTAMPGAKFIALHKNHLALGFEPGSVQFSGIGDPSSWDAATGGAGEIGVGETLTGLLLGRGGTLHVLCRDSIKTIYGDSTANFELRVTVPNSGAKPYSAQNFINPQFIAEQGFSGLESTDQFGDFRPFQPGAKVEPIFRDAELANQVVCSMVSKDRGQYRVLFDNGTGLYSSPTGITMVKFPDKMRVAHSGELQNGEEIILAGDDKGRVYRMDNEAYTFNGEPIEAFLSLAYNDLGNPTVRKRFRRAWWDIRSGTDAEISIQPDFDFGQAQSSRHLRQIVRFILGGGRWNVDDWDDLRWSVPILAQRPVDITGSGTAVNFSIYSNAPSAPFEVLGYDIVFEQRRLRRG